MLLYLPVITNVVLVDLCYSVQGGATTSALVLLSGNVLLLWLERQRLLAALKILTQHAANRAESLVVGTKASTPSEPGWSHRDRAG